MTLQIEEATLPSSKSDEKSVKQSTRTRSSKREMRVEEEESTGEEAPTSEEAQANGEQLQVSDFLMWKMFYHQLLCLNVF